jgi:hypothetical protein
MRVHAPLKEHKDGSGAAPTAEVLKVADSQADVSGGRRTWPFRSWQFWSGLLAGAGLGLLCGAALVELEWLTLHSKAWVSVLGCVLFGAGALVPVVTGGPPRS